MRAVRIGERAEADLEAIWHWTREAFGARQADRYLYELDEGMRACGAALVRRHVIFYTFTDDEVMIRRVLHGSMDFGRRLAE